MVIASGVELLVTAHHVRRGEWRSGHPAQRAMTLGQTDGFLFIPWTTEWWLHLPVTEVLTDWARTRPPEHEAIRIVAGPADPRWHRLRDRALASAPVPIPRSSGTTW